MAERRDLPKRLWDTGRELPIIGDEQTPWKMIKILRFITLLIIAVMVFGLALCSKASFLVLITLANNGSMTLPQEQKPLILLLIGCSLIASSVLIFLKSVWKACYKSSKLPRMTTTALVMFFEFMVSVGAAILTIVAMPHLDIVTNLTILNSVAVVSALLQVLTQSISRERNCFLLPSIIALVFIIQGYVLFLVLHLHKETTDTKMTIYVGLAVTGSFLLSFNWWENYFRAIAKNSKSDFLKNLCKDMTKSQNVLHILSTLIRISVTASVLGAYVPLAQLNWDILKNIPRYETRFIAITIGVQLISSVLCHWFTVVSCKMHALRRCFVMPLYMASLAVAALFIVPVFVFYGDHGQSPNGTASINFTGYCNEVVYGRNESINGSVFTSLVLDVTHTLCFLDTSKSADIGLLTGSAVSWWLGFILATLHLWKLSMFRIERTQDLFMRRLYEGAFIEQSLLLNIRYDIQTRKKKEQENETVKLYLCATMWHETYSEMMNIIISIFRLDKYRPQEGKTFDDFTFEAHIYFDDAFENAKGGQERRLNSYATDLVGILADVYGIFTNIDKRFFTRNQHIPDQTIIKTPYGGRLVLTMPHGNKIIAHFKDKDLIRHKKRWSQVMYLYYLLGWKLMTKYYRRLQRGEDEDDLKKEAEKEKHNTYLLALDGDTDFQPAAVVLLIDRLKMYPKVGAACGRIHPTGSGPAVWFQKFEYAVSHWLQKTAEHVFGCVLCSPGCFSLFRAEALMDNNVMKTYCTKSTEASHYIQYDQGEDRWLCTLLLKQGWRVEYNAASDAYTNAPEDFKELFNQRRRWGPSTMANVVDLLGSTSIISKRNPSMSKPFMFYQLFNMGSAILAPATICLMIAGSLTFITNIPGNSALVLALIPPIIFLILCFKIKADNQIKVAAVLGIGYAFLMLVVTMSIIGAMLRDQTILTPSSMFIVIMALIYIITAILHPQEIGLVFHGLLYILCVPSAYLLLTIYSMTNMNNVSWGTREAKPAAGAGSAAVTTPQTAVQKAKSSIQQFFNWIKCCKKSNQRSGDEPVNISQQNLVTAQLEDQPQNTIVGDVNIPEEDRGEGFSDVPVQCWVTQLQTSTSKMQLREDSLDEDEVEFWKDLQDRYLQPLVVDKETQKKIADDLRALRNKINFAFFIIDALWLVTTFTLQSREDTFSIKLPKVNFNLTSSGEEVRIDPLAFMFILGFALSIVFQFFAMLFHRIYTLIHYVAFLDTEPQEKRDDETSKSTNSEKEEEEQISNVSIVDSDFQSGSDDSDDDSMDDWSRL